MEQAVDQVDETSTTSIITFLKAVPATITVADGVILGDGSLGFAARSVLGKRGPA